MSLDNKEQEIKNITKQFLSIAEEEKKLKEQKKDLEERLKLLMEENDLKTINTSEYKITYSNTERTNPVKSSDIVEIFHKNLLQKKETREIAEEIMDLVRQEMENKKVKKPVKTLRVSKN